MKRHVNKFAAMAAEVIQMRRNITRQDIDAMSDKEKLELVKEETQLNSNWNAASNISSLLTCPTCESAEHLYIFDDNKTAYCLDCAMECDLADCDADGHLVECWPDELAGDSEYTLEEMVSDDPRLAAELADKILNANSEPSSLEAAKRQVQNQTKNYLPKHRHVYTGKGKAAQSQTGFEYQWKNCTHRPQHIIAGEGWGIWAGKKDDVRAFASEYDLVLNLTYTSIKTYTHRIPVAELKEWEDYGYRFTELQLDWPDYGVINLPKEFWVKLLAYIKEKNQRVLVFCQGGHGRTGTALALLLCLSLGYDPDAAIRWVRKNYCENAIETMAQEAYVWKIAGQEMPIAELPAKNEAASLAASKSN